MKIVLVIAMGLMSIVANAAAVAWSTTAVKGPDGVAVGASTAYTATVMFWADNSGAVGDIVSTTGTTDSTAAMSKYANTTGDSFTGGKTYWTQLIIKANDNSFEIASAIASFTLDSSAEYAINFSSGAGFATSGAKIDYAGGWVAAPEPTSGLLLLLGVAGLALKRKRA